MLFFSTYGQDIQAVYQGHSLAETAVLVHSNGLVIEPNLGARRCLAADHDIGILGAETVQRLVKDDRWRFKGLENGDTDVSQQGHYNQDQSG